jgi:hypothetical protein
MTKRIRYPMVDIPKGIRCPIFDIPRGMELYNLHCWYGPSLPLEFRIAYEILDSEPLFCSGSTAPYPRDKQLEKLPGGGARTLYLIPVRARSAPIYRKNG